MRDSIRESNMGQSKDGFYHELLNVLKQDSEKRFYADNGDLLRNKVAECAMNLDNELIKLLLSNEKIKNRFFTKVDDLLVFDKMAFVWAINNKAFLKDSYTRFKNKIGFTDENGQFISSKKDVVLSFPYKDCILEGGQTKEDRNRDEIYYNELLAPDDIDRLLAPKVFTNAKKYTKDNVIDITKFDENDNLIIKGNNLLGLSSLLGRFENSIKCVFIDPPYYFIDTKPSDTFCYNSNFKLSTWLVFMKNRLEQTYKLLKKNGVLFITISDEGAHYLKVLADEIFDMENFIADITWEARKSISSDGLMSMNSNHILVYAKDKNTINKNNFRLALNIEDFKYDNNDGKGCYRLEPFDAPNIRKNLEYDIVNPNTGEVFKPPVGRCWRTEKTTYEKYLAEGKIRFGINGNAKPQYKAYYNEVKNAGKGKASSTIFHDIDMQTIIWSELDTNTNATKDLVSLFGSNVFTNPKPEDLLKRIIELSTDENDIVLDYYMGSATTQSVAMKMRRRFIGIEQMDYINTVSIEKLKKVMNGEDSETKVAKAENWTGGGSFVYCELKELNQKFVDEIKVANDKKLNELYNTIISSEFISYKAEINKLKDSEQEFEQLSIDDKKKFLIEVLDKNMLYVNYCDIDDNDFEITEQEKAFTKSFYGDT